MFKKIKRVYYSFINGIENLIKWFPVIWADRDWDYAFIYEILKKKLEYTERFFRSDKAWSARALEDADNINHTIVLLDRLLSHDYTSEALKPFKEKFPNYKWDMQTEPCEDNPKLHRIIDHDTPEQKELLHRCYRVSEALEENDFNEFFDFLKLHIKEWWD